VQDARFHRASSASTTLAHTASTVISPIGVSVVQPCAAQPGVRYSLKSPAAYVQSNLVGFANLLEGCRRCPPRHLVFASSSSVYGDNPKLPWSESDNVDHPISLYAATKKSNELMAHVYSHLHGISATGLRYFTAYGPWGRPDMSPVLFAHAIMQGKPIEVFNHGDMQRDFTYIDDIVEGTLRVLDQPAPYALYNIGNHQPMRRAIDSDNQKRNDSIERIDEGLLEFLENVKRKPGARLNSETAGAMIDRLSIPKVLQALPAA
jgi:nucleoside-diphosphate-sugar epimerase